MISNARVALKNIINFGILIDPSQWTSYFYENPLNRPTFFLMLLLNVFILFGVFIEKLVSKRVMSETKAQQLIIGNIINALISPIIVNLLFVCNALLSSVVCSFYSIVILKLISYHSVNYWCRTGIRYGKPIDQTFKDSGSPNKESNEANLVKYPNNLTLIDIYYFMFAPTLCYQLNFPRTPRIRKRFLIKTLIQYVSVLVEK